MVRTKQKSKLPVQQLAILAICRFAEPIAATSIHPYLPEMIQSFGVPIDQVAKYTGRLSSTFSLTGCLTAIIWGHASDQLGRKPMILLALSILMLGNISFGFSKSLRMAFAARFIQGFASGDVGIIRTTVAEMVPQKELQPRAFSIMPLVFVTGVIIGPIIGGNLSRPVERYGGIFAQISLLKRYPFVLPHLATSALFVIGIMSGFFFLKETHQDKKSRKDYGLVLGEMILCSGRQSWSRRASNKSWDGPDDVEPLLGQHKKVSAKQVVGTHEAKPVQKATFREVLTQQSCINLAAYAGLAMHTMAFFQMLPVFMHHPRDDHTPTPHNPLHFGGGYGYGAHRIGIMFTIYGVFGMFVQFLIFPPVTRKYGPLLCLKVCAIALPATYFLMPFTTLIKSNSRQQAACIALMLVKCCGGMFGFPCVSILLTNSASSLRTLGTLNGIATSLAALGQAAGPALTAFTFPFGVRTGYIVFPFWINTLVAIISAIPVWWLIESNGFDSDENENDDSGVDDEDIARNSPITTRPVYDGTVSSLVDASDAPGLGSVDLKQPFSDRPGHMEGFTSRTVCIHQNDEEGALRRTKLPHTTGGTRSYGSI